MKYRLLIPLMALLLGALPLHPALANSAPPEGEGEGGDAKPPESTLLALKPLPIALLKGGRVDKYIVVMMSIDPALESDAEAIKHDLPKINDALLREAFLAGKEYAGATNLEMEALRKRFLPVVETILGEKKILGLYFTGVNSL